MKKYDVKIKLNSKVKSNILKNILKREVYNFYS